MGLFQKLRRAIKARKARITRAVSTVKRKLRKAVSKIRAAPRIIIKDIKTTSRSLRRKAGGVYEAADVAARGYLPGHISPTVSKTRRLRKGTQERTELSRAEAQAQAVDIERKLRREREEQREETQLAILEAYGAEEREPYIIREDLATRGFLEIPSATERALTGQKEQFIGSEQLEQYTGAISPFLKQATGASGFGEEVKKAGLGIGAVVIALAALIGLSKLPKARRK